MESNECCVWEVKVFFLWVINLVNIIDCLGTVIQVKGFGFGDIFKDQQIKLRPRSIDVDSEGVKVSHSSSIKPNLPLTFTWKTGICPSFIQTSVPHFILWCFWGFQWDLAPPLPQFKCYSAGSGSLFSHTSKAEVVAVQSEAASWGRWDGTHMFSSDCADAAKLSLWWTGATGR